jgi:predicted MFS family arabinose efflux permease
VTDTRWIFVAQAGRAFGYGLAAVLLGGTLAAGGLNATQVGLLLAAIVAGTVVASLTVGVAADRAGRRRTYLALYCVLGVTGVVFATTSRWPVLVAVALVGVLSTEVVESGPFTTVEQAMLATVQPDPKPLMTGFGRYNAIAAAAGSLGALAAALPDVVRRLWPAAPADRRYFAALAVVAMLGIVASARLSSAVEPVTVAVDARPAVRTVPVVWRLAGLFAVDSFAGGFIVQAFLVYWLQQRYGASTAATGVVLFSLGVLQTLSFLTAPLLAHRIGLLPTMVFTHLPSNVLLAAFAFAPNLAAAIGLLLARAALSQMDVPTRQAYVMTLVPPVQRTRAAAVTNTARYLTRPAGTALLGPAQLLGAGVPFMLAGAVKTGYDLILWAWFRHVQLPDPGPCSWSNPVGDSTVVPLAVRAPSGESSEDAGRWDGRR